MQLTRRGFTLVELLIALVLLGVVSAALYRVLYNNQRVYTAQTERIEMQQNIRAAATILPAELRELNAVDGDITTMTATQLSIRAQRWLGVACVAPVLPGGVTLTIMGGAPGAPLFFGARGPNANTDSLLVWYDGNPNIRTDDRWIPARLTATAPGVCPGSNAAGLQLTFTFVSPWPAGVPNVNGAIPAGAPVRGFERVTYQLYQAAGDTSWYIGFQPAGGTMQPLIGPVLPNGLSFAYFDSLGAATTTPARVARIDVTVMARTTQQVQTSGQGGQRTLVDTVVTSVALRNNKRF